MANLIQPIAIPTDIPVAEEESLTVKCEPQSTMDTFEGQEWPQFSIASSADDFKQRVSERDKQIALFREREKNKANFLRQRSIAKIRRTEEFLRQREGMKKKARLINDMHAKERAHLKELLREKSFTKSISNHAKLLSNTDRHLAKVEVGLCKSGGKLPLVKFDATPKGAIEVSSSIKIKNLTCNTTPANLHKYANDSETGERICLISSDIFYCNDAERDDKNKHNEKELLSVQQEEPRPSFGRRPMGKRNEGRTPSELCRKSIDRFEVGEWARMKRGKQAEHVNRGHLSQRDLPQPIPMSFFDQEFAKYSNQSIHSEDLPMGKFSTSIKFVESLVHLDEMRNRQMKSMKILLKYERELEVDRQAMEASGTSRAQKRRLQGKYMKDREKSRHRILRVAREHELALASRMASMGLIR
jgi:hypothetical protein